MLIYIEKDGWIEEFINEGDSGRSGANNKEFVGEIQYKWEGGIKLYIEEWEKEQWSATRATGEGGRGEEREGCEGATGEGREGNKSLYGRGFNLTFIEGGEVKEHFLKKVWQKNTF